MIVYVESNFVLEMVLGQEQAASADALLTLAESGAVDLVLPGFALAEPFGTITQRDRARGRLVGDLSATLRDLRRSSPYVDEAALVANAVAGLAGITGREYANLRTVIQRLLAHARTYELNAACFAQALDYQQQFELSPQDSIIYASVISDLRTKPQSDAKCFITRNSRDFDDPGIVAELNGYTCRLFFSFADGFTYCAP